jgi:hypothetical protein
LFNQHRPTLKPLLLAIATVFVVAVVAPDASAESDMKRGAGERKGNTLSSKKSGGGSMRSSSRSAPSLPSENRRKKKDKDEDKWSSYSSKYDDDDEEPDFGSRSLGRVCMYGAKGEVVFRPRGARCRGDAPAARDESAEMAPPGERARPSRGRTSAAHPARQMEPRKRRPSRPRPASECVYGSEGQVIHTPAGGFCRPQKPKE